jgi:thymidylate kinase
MIAGVNGAGKTTSIGKLAKYFQAQGKIGAARRRRHLPRRRPRTAA